MAGKFWIIIISEDNLECTINNNLIGLPARLGEKYIRKMTDGDHIVFYIGKKRAGYTGRNWSVCDFGPIYKIVGPVFFDEKPIWNSRTGEKYPWRRRISLVLNKRTSARSILHNLSFIRPKVKWGLYFIRSVREITSKDYETIIDAISQQ